MTHESHPGAAPATGRECRIAVIGAGCSGLILARRLEERGYRRVTVLEREPDVGGQIRSLPTGHGDEIWELGAVVPTSGRLLRLLRSHGLRRSPWGGFADSDGPSPGLSLRSLWETVRFIAFVTRWRHRLVTPTMASAPPELAVPVAEWLDRHGYRALRRPLLANLSAQSDHYPATGWTMWAFLKVLVHLSLPHFLLRRVYVPDGYQELWRRVAANLSDVRTDTEVVGVTRDGGGATVATRSGEELRFDRVVLACPLRTTVSWLEPSPEEERIFSRIRCQTFVKSYHRIEGLTAGVGVWRYFDANVLEESRRGRPVAFYPACHHGRKDTFVFYHYARPDTDDESLVGWVREEVERLGARLVETLLIHRWHDHNPYFSAADIRDGIYDRLESLQGHRGTWYTGETIAGRGVHLCLLHAERLADRYFPIPEDSSSGGADDV